MGEKVTRRDFLKGLAVGAAAGVVASAGVAAAVWPKPVTTTLTSTSTVPGPTTTKTLPTTLTTTKTTTSTVPTTVTTTLPATTVTATVPTTVTVTPPAVKEPVERKTIELTVNGEKYLIDVPVYWTLARVLREKLNLTGTKIGCDTGECGACTVLVDGKPVLSCMTLAVDCDGKNITTIEGLADPETGKLHPLQQAVADHVGYQCGYCTAGNIMAAKALLDENPHPTEDEVKEALSGHVCRCGAFYSFVESVMIAAKMMAAKGGA